MATCHLIARAAGLASVARGGGGGVTRDTDQAAVVASEGVTGPCKREREGGVNEVCVCVCDREMGRETLEMYRHSPSPHQ